MKLRTVWLLAMPSIKTPRKNKTKQNKSYNRLNEAKENMRHLYQRKVDDCGEETTKKCERYREMLERMMK